MRSTFKRTAAFFAAILAAAMLFAVAAPSAMALTYNGSASYKTGPYYTKLCEVELTGDQRVDVVNVAKSQVGYHESDSASDLSGTTNGSNNGTEYAEWYDKTDFQLAPWCAMFVSWCAYVAGVPESTIYKHAYTPYGLEWFQERNRAYSREDVAAGKYTPESGDIVYFKGDTTAPTNHIGYVTDYSDGKLSTVEGNASDSVVERTYEITDTYIVYVCRPAYNTPAEAENLNTWFDDCGVADGGIMVRGWCYDKDSTATTLELEVYVGGIPGEPGTEVHTGILANTFRGDVDAAFGCGANHGFNTTVTTKKVGNAVPVTVYAVNPETGARKWVGSRIVDTGIAFAILGSYDAAEPLEGAVCLKGWTFDNVDTTKSLTLEVYIGGDDQSQDAEKHTITADKERTDANNVYGCGDYHGFEETINTDKTGEQDVYIYAIAANGTDRKLLGVKSVDIPAAQAVLVGDTNNDGKLNNKDVVTLFRYVSTGGTGADMSVYDVNNDGKINNKDVVALFRIISSK